VHRLPREVLRKRDHYRTESDAVIKLFRASHTEELGHLYESRGIVSVLKFGRLRRSGNVIRIGKQRMHEEFW
jgi:hypothetical protein